MKVPYIGLVFLILSGAASAVMQKEIVSYKDGDVELEGHLYWDLMFKPEWTLVPRFPPGDGQLIYPGDLTLAGAPSWALVKDLKGPVVSRRLKMLRQGLQEWELLKLAETKAGRATVQRIVDGVYTCMGRRTWAPDAYDPARPMWSYDESTWDRARRQVIEAAVNGAKE